MSFTREQTLARLRERLASGVPIIGGGAGTGISAKFEEAGGIDLIIIYNSGRYRMAGRGSLAGLMPYGDANQIVMDMAGEVLTIVKDTPVLAGICASDPFRQMDRFLNEVKEIGFAGIQNFPTVGLIDGSFRANLEETGMGYDREVELVRLARQKDLLTTPYAFNTEEAERMADAGADVIVAHMGLTTKGTIGAETAFTLEQSVVRVQEIADAAHGVLLPLDGVHVVARGGPRARRHRHAARADERLAAELRAAAGGLARPAVRRRLLLGDGDGHRHGAVRHTAGDAGGGVRDLRLPLSRPAAQRLRHRLDGLRALVDRLEEADLPRAARDDRQLPAAAQCQVGAACQDLGVLRVPVHFVAGSRANRAAPRPRDAPRSHGAP